MAQMLQDCAILRQFLRDAPGGRRRFWLKKRKERGLPQRAQRSQRGWGWQGI